MVAIISLCSRRRGASLTRVVMLWSFVVGLMASLTAQAPCFDTSPNNLCLFSSAGGPNLFLGVKYTNGATTLSVDAMETFTGHQKGTYSVGIWSHDAQKDQPLARLGEASWSMSPVASWQGAMLEGGGSALWWAATALYGGWH